MKTRLLLITGIVLLISAVTTQAEITDVFIFPEEPMVTDTISILVSGVESYSFSIADSTLTINESSLDLDIYLGGGIMPVVTPWSHTEDIGILLAGTYDLTVNTLFDQYPIYNDSFATTFEVVPEPATILLLGVGGLILRRR